MRFLITAAMALIIVSPAVAHETPADKSSKTKSSTAESKPASPTPIGGSHSGGTDSKGCHTDHKTGDYHCHKPKP